MRSIASRLCLAAGSLLILCPLAAAASDFQMLPPTPPGSNSPTGCTYGNNSVLVMGGNGAGGYSAISCNQDFFADAAGNTQINGTLSVTSPNASVGSLSFGIAGTAGQADINYNGGSDSILYFSNTGSAAGGTGFGWANGGTLTTLLYLANSGTITLGGPLGLANGSGLVDSSCSTAGQIQYDSTTSAPVYCSGATGTWQSMAGAPQCVQRTSTTYTPAACGSTSQIYCNAGEVATGGGTASNPNNTLQESYPLTDISGNSIGWEVIAYAGLAGCGAVGPIYATVVCCH